MPKQVVMASPPIGHDLLWYILAYYTGLLLHKVLIELQILGVDNTTGSSIYPEETFYTSPPVKQVSALDV